MCPHATSCPMYETFRLKALLQIWRGKFCDTTSQYPACRRYQLMLQGSVVPATMLPNGDDLGKPARRAGR